MEVFKIQLSKEEEDTNRLYVFKIKNKPFGTFFITIEIVKNSKTFFCVLDGRPDVINENTLGKSTKIEEYQILFDDFVSENFIPIDKEMNCLHCLSFNSCRRKLLRHKEKIDRVIDSLNDMLQKGDKNDK